MSIDIDRMEAWARHGAAADPDAVLALIARLRETEKERDDHEQARTALEEALGQVMAERDALAAHYHVIRRELGACQRILHQLARAGEVTPAYAEDAKMALADEPATSLVKRDAALLDRMAVALNDDHFEYEAIAPDAAANWLHEQAEEMRRQAEQTR